MESLHIMFAGRERVELLSAHVAEPEGDEVLCAAKSSLISTGTELQCLKGVFDKGTNWEEWVHYPFHPGYSMAATIVKTGPGVRTFQAGDRVAVAASHSQYFTARESELYHLPEWVSFEEGAWKSLICTTQLGVRRASLALGETVGVIGLGLLGQLVVQYLHVSGARRIIGIDTSSHRLALASSRGLTDALNLDAAAARESVGKITGGRMLDVVFDVTGHPSVLAPAIQLVRKMGRVVLLGDTATPTRQFLGPGVVNNSISILGIHAEAYPPSYSELLPWSDHEMTDLFFGYLLAGRMSVKDLISSTVSPYDAVRTYAELSARRSESMGVVFDWSRIGAGERGNK